MSQPDVYVQWIQSMVQYYSMSPSKPEVSVIIVNWNVADLLETCLTTLKKYTKDITYEVIVVDNASTDNSVQRLQANHKWVRLFPQSQNLGFTKGNNLGLSYATGRDICFLNPDTEFRENTICRLVRFLSDHPTVGIVGPNLRNSDLSHQPSIGQFPGVTSIAREYVLPFAVPSPLPHPDHPCRVDFVLGACMVVRGDICRQVGGFDERYFMYQEELDMSRTFLSLGYETYYVPSTQLIHHGSKSATKSIESRQRTLHENRKSQILFMRKHSTLLSSSTVTFMIALALSLRLVPFAILVGSGSLKYKVKYHYTWLTIRWILFKS